MRVLLYSFIVLMTALLPVQAINQTKSTQKTHAISMHQDVKYPKDFKHFGGVNPKAPKGGTLKLGVVGTFDSTNPFITKGTAPVGLSLYSERVIFEGLLMRSPDEPFTLYGWLAESLEVAPDRSWIIFYVNPKARWADGKPVTPQDVVFSHETLRDKGAPNMRMMYSKVKSVELVGKQGVKFTFKTQEDGTYNPEMPLLIGLMSVIPKHFFEGKDFEKTSLEFVIGSGPYKIVDLKPGHRIVYERRDDYWGAELPVMVGKNNFDRVAVEYYREVNVARLAFESGEYDYRAELDISKQQDIRKKSASSKRSIVEYEHKNPVALTTYCMNSRREIFKDRRVRLALSYAFDFHWLNKNLFYGAFKRNRSFFENTDLSHQGLPTQAELKLLEPFRDQIPAEVFKKPYYPANYHETSDYRGGLKTAQALLKEAGWEIQEGVLRHSKTGQPFAFELMLYNKNDEKIALAFARSLKRLGIQMTIRTLDAAQYEMRRLKFDYDMILNAWFAGRSPGAELTFYWGSKMADQEGSRNYPGIKSEAIGFLCKYIAAAKTREELVTGSHALDRLLMWGHYVIPLSYNNRVFVAHASKLAYPEIDPNRSLSLATWWMKVPETK